MTAPSPAFLRWWAAQHAATRVYVGAYSLERWVDVCDEIDRAARDFGAEDWALVESFTLYTRAARKQIDERARREEP